MQPLVSNMAKPSLSTLASSPISLASNYYIPNMRSMLLAIALVSFAFAANPAKEDSSIAAVAIPDTIYDTVYVATDDGIPWNHENFPRERLLRHPTFDPALTVAYTYSASIIGGSFGTFAQQSYLAHWNYEFSPDLHLFGAVGLWMPLYSNLNYNIAKEDVQQGTVRPVIPNVGLEYRINNNAYLRIGVTKEDDALRAYGPMHRYYGPWRNSNFYP